MNSTEIFNIKDLQNIILEYKNQMEELKICSCGSEYINRYVINGNGYFELLDDIKYLDQDLYKGFFRKKNQKEMMNYDCKDEMLNNGIENGKCCNCWIDYLDTLRVKELKSICKFYGRWRRFKGYSTMVKDDLYNMIIKELKILFLYSMKCDGVGKYF